MKVRGADADLQDSTHLIRGKVSVYGSKNRITASCFILGQGVSIEACSWSVGVVRFLKRQRAWEAREKEGYRRPLVSLAGHGSKSFNRQAASLRYTSRLILRPAEFCD